MSLTVLSHYTRSINGKYDGKILQAYIVKHLIVSSLKKSRIYGKDRLEAAFCQTCGKSYSMLFRNSYIKKPILKFLGEFA
ncbi:hypothetical protein SDC9_139273 [bioreactor metagenome]|uniref:Uncharacterized protein n=1 Tax=bioreactor metagenome TaxID=1076179 RepID=A0A645DSN3_9ZZZZ